MRSILISLFVASSSFAQPTPPGGGGTNSGGGLTFYSPVYGSNDFWLQALSLGTNTYNTNAANLTLLLHGTIADVAYQLFSTTNLQPTGTVWTVEQNLIGSEITNFTPTTISMTGRPTLYFKALASTVDSDGDGLPDWWEQKYSTVSFPLSSTNSDTGNTGIQDGDKQDSAGDGYSNLQKYQMGVAPNVLVTPAQPNGFTLNLDTNGIAHVSWSPAANLPSYGAGAVTGYTLSLGGTTISLTAGQTNYTVTTNTDYWLGLYLHDAFFYQNTLPMSCG